MNFVPVLEFKPEPIPVLLARLPQALEKPWDAVDAFMKRTGPGAVPAYIFDTDTPPMRFVVSRDLLPPRSAGQKGRDYLHVSASWPNMEREQAFARPSHVEFCWNTFARLEMPPTDLHLVTEKGTHVFWEWDVVQPILLKAGLVQKGG